MKSTLKNRFPAFLDPDSLRTAIEAVCSEFGAVTHLQILPARRGGTLDCACFLRLDSPAAEAALSGKLRVIRFAGDIYFEVEVAEGWTGRIA